MVATVRGGVPHVVRDSITTAGRKIRLPFYTLSMIARNKGANVVRLYFTEADFTANANYVELPVASAILPHGEWAGPVETTAGIHADVWVKSIIGASAVELVFFQRRG